MNARWITYKAKDGVLETHLDFDEGRPALEFFIRKALDLVDRMDESTPAEYKFVDTFFSDSISDTLVEMILRKAYQQELITRFLLVNPFSNFAKSRATSIEQDLHQESVNGLKLIAAALVRSKNLAIPAELLTSNDISAILKTIRSIARNKLEIRFYSDSPSGPMYFIRNLLLCGRFNAGTTAANLPWTMIINDPNIKRDLFDVQESEFKYLWENGTHYPEDISSKEFKFNIFISYRKNDSVWQAQSLNNYLVEEFGPESVFIDFASIRVGSDFEKEIFQTIENCNVFIPIIGNTWLDGISDEEDYVRREIEAAFQQEITVFPIYIGETTNLSSNDIPTTIRKLAAIQGLRIRPGPDYLYDIKIVINELSKIWKDLI